MNKVQRWVLALAGGLLFSLIMIVASCGPEDTPTPSVTVSESPTPVEPTETPPPEPPVEPFLFVANQVLVTGPVTEVTEAVSYTSDKLQIGFEQLQRLDLQDAGIGPDTAQCAVVGEYLETLGDCLAEHESWVLDLYQLDGNGSVAEMVDIVQLLNQTGCVFSHPNYLTGDPWTGVGSPWTGVGSPWTGVGSPWTGAGTATVSTMQDEFERQWAFEMIGLTSGGARRIEQPTGSGIRIGVFDSSPFALEESNGPVPVTIDWATPWGTAPFTLTVRHPQFLGSLPTPLPDGVLTPTLANHGLFVAGLVHAVAPDGDIHLFRVLNENLQGDLFTLDAALYAFITETAPDEDGLKRAVINLSMGIHPPADKDAPGLPTAVVALELLLAGARCQGMTVVAASGNDRHYPNPAPEPQIPAQYDFVLGVAAVNSKGEPACFSNRGRVAAPGGDGEGDKTCVPCTRDCEQKSVISLISEEPPGYAYWVGTSFAAPLASGQAALLLESGADPFSLIDRIANQVGPVSNDPDHVVEAGIIDAPNSLTPTPQPQ